jgi:replication factor A1
LLNILIRSFHRWTIRVRVAHKKPIRTFSNGEGRLFSCDFIDETGEIRATGFGDDCDRFEPILIVGNVISFFPRVDQITISFRILKIYYITQAQIKYANKQFNTLHNDFEMTFNNETIIESCIDNIPSIPIQRLHFIPIDQIQNMENNSFIGLLKNISI